MSVSVKAEAEAIRLDALTRLGVARREKLIAADYTVYLDGLQHFEPEIVKHVCGNLAMELPGEFEPRFPPLAAIVERCRAALRVKWEREDEERRARMPMLADPHNRQVSSEKFANFKADVQREIARKRMR